MANSGLESGIKITGNKPGIKSGRAMSPIKGGMLSGLSDGKMTHTIMQDPALITGVQAPIVYWNAESCAVNASNNVLSVTNLAAGSAETFAIGSDPNRVSGSVRNGKAAIAFDASDYISTSLIMGGKTEATVFLVAKADGGSGTLLLNFRWDSINDTPGDFTLTSLAGKVRSDLYGNPDTTNSTYDSYPISVSEFYTITVKLRLSAPNGNGSEHELYINGVRQKAAVATTYTAATSFFDSALYFGGNSSQFAGGNTIAAGLVFDYAVNDAMQRRIENYFRWYYGLRF